MPESTNLFAIILKKKSHSFHPKGVRSTVFLLFSLSELDYSTTRSNRCQGFFHFFQARFLRKKHSGDQISLPGCFSAVGGIRTPVGLPPNGFQDRLVMTASIPLQTRCFFNAPLYFISSVIPCQFKSFTILRCIFRHFCRPVSSGLLFRSRISKPFRISPVLRICHSGRTPAKLPRPADPPVW